MISEDLDAFDGPDGIRHLHLPLRVVWALTDRIYPCNQYPRGVPPILTITDLCNTSADDLMRRSDIGPMSVREIIKSLRRMRIPRNQLGG